MKQNYQTIDVAVAALAVPDAVSVALGEVVADVREGLLAMAVGTGLQVMAAIMEADVTAVCGPKGKHDPARSAVRHGSEKGAVTLGGRRVPGEHAVDLGLRQAVMAAGGLRRADFPLMDPLLQGRVADAHPIGGGPYG